MAKAALFVLFTLVAVVLLSGAQLYCSGGACPVILTSGVSGVLPIANGGTNASSASITAFNNITGYTAAGATGTTSTNVVFSTSPSITTPKIITSLTDTNGNTWINIGATASAVNYIKVTNAATGTAGPTVAADGETNTDLNIAAKGTGAIHYGSGTYCTPVAYSPSAAATATLTLNVCNSHTITMPAGNITIALSNEHVGQYFTIRIIQDSVGSRTVTWFTTIKWSGGSAPTLTTAATKEDLITCLVTGSGTYDCSFTQNY